MKQRKRKPKAVDDTPIKLIELQAAVIQHCAALRCVVNMLVAKRHPAAVARLDCASAAMLAVVRGQCVGVTMECPQCRTAQNVVAWVDNGTCDHCGEKLELPSLVQRD